MHWEKYYYHKICATLFQQDSGNSKMVTLRERNYIWYTKSGI